MLNELLFKFCCPSLDVGIINALQKSVGIFGALNFVQILEALNFVQILGASVLER